MSALSAFTKEWLKAIASSGLGSLSGMRYLPRWRKAQLQKSTPLESRIPWINYHAIDFLEAHLKPEMQVFEYGGGGSTLFFLDRVRKVFTVEHDAQWFHDIERLIRDEFGENWSGKLIEAEPAAAGSKKDPADPADFASDDAQFKNLQFRRYCTEIDQYPDEFFDLVMVDGRSRTSCMLHAMPKVKTGGYLVLDNSERSYYTSHVRIREALSSSFRKLEGFHAPQPFARHFTTTSVWQKKTR